MVSITRRLLTYRRVVLSRVLLPFSQVFGIRCYCFTSGSTRYFIFKKKDGEEKVETCGCRKKQNLIVFCVLSLSPRQKSNKILFVSATALNFFSINQKSQLLLFPVLFFVECLMVSVLYCYPLLSLDHYCICFALLNIFFVT